MSGETSASHRHGGQCWSFFLQAICMTSLWDLWARGISSQVGVCGIGWKGLEDWPRYVEVKCFIFVLRGRDRTFLDYSEGSLAPFTQPAWIHSAAVAGSRVGDLWKIVPLQLGKEGGQGGSASCPSPKPSMPLLPNSVSQCCPSLLGQGEGHFQKKSLLITLLTLC